LQVVAQHFQDAANWLSKIVFDRKKPGTPASLHREFYGTIRAKFGLTSQVTCSLFKTVVGTYRSMKSNHEWSLAKYKKPIIPVVFKRDFSHINNKLVFWKIPMEYKCRKLPQGIWRDSKLKLIQGQWYLCLVIAIDIPEPKETGNIVGVDAGQKNILTAVEPKSNQTLYVRGGVLNHLRFCIRQTRAKVASVGTRSAHQLLKRLSGREKAVTQNMLHIASKQLVAFAKSVDAKTIVMENLTGLKKNSGKHNKKLHHKQRARNNRWPYALCQFFIGYKAAAEGINIDFVGPAYTSQGCSRCGHTEKANRNGLKFRCLSCNWQDNADRNGAWNIASRSLLQRQAVAERALCQQAYSSSEGNVPTSYKPTALVNPLVG
jgi:IS605 OrfB family transposase